MQDLDRITPDWGILEWDQYIYIPMNRRVAIPNFARGCPFTCSFCSQWKFWRDYRIRDPKKVVDEIENLADAKFAEIDQSVAVPSGRVSRIFRPKSSNVQLTIREFGSETDFSSDNS